MLFIILIYHQKTLNEINNDDYNSDEDFNYDSDLELSDVSVKYNENNDIKEVQHSNKLLHDKLINIININSVTAHFMTDHNLQKT